jgi:hypothetical protein
MQKKSDTFTASVGGLAGATAGTYPLALTAVKKLYITDVEISAESSGSFKIFRAESADVSAGVAYTPVNMSGPASVASTATALKGTRTVDITSADDGDQLQAQALPSVSPVNYPKRGVIELDVGQTLLVLVLVATDDDLVYTDVEYQEAP